MAKDKAPSFEKEKIIKTRLGVRLKRFYWPLDMNIIGEMLKKLGYRDIEFVNNQIYDAQKPDISFYLDQSRLVFGFNAKNVEKLITTQKEFFALAEKDYLTNLSEFVRFYEIEYVSNYYSEKSVHDTMKSLYKDSQQIAEFEKIVEQPVIPKGIDLVSKDNPIQSDRWFQILIEPKIEAVNNVYYCRILYRDNTLQTLYAYAKKCSSTIHKTIEKLEAS